MRPYLAIIKDSFREAMASRVLWVMLVLITAFLAASAPVGMTEQGQSTFGPSNIIGGDALGKKLFTQQAADRPSPGKHIWPMLRPETRHKLSANPPQPLSVDSWAEELNLLLARPDLYHKASWKDVTLNEEAQQLLQHDPEKLSKERLARRNRLLLDAAFHDELLPAGGQELYLSYAFLWRSEEPLRATKETILHPLLTFLVDSIFGTVGVLTAILVTSTMIPRTFEAGSVDLLISKPVSRYLVYLSKFFGGCVFIFINASYLVVGLWLIVGLRLGEWNHGLLLCIPVLMFLFAVYYSVSALAGLFWNNAIIAVVITVVFWASCVLTSIVKRGMEGLFFETQAIVQILPVGDELFTINRLDLMSRMGAVPPGQRGSSSADQVQQWDAADRRWKTAKLSAVLKEPQPEELPRGFRIPIPGGSMALFAFDQEKLLLVTARGLFYWQPPADDRNPFNVRSPGGLFDLGFKDAGDKVDFDVPFSAAVDSVTGDLAVHDGRKLYLFKLNAQGKFRLASKLDSPTEERTVMAYGSGVVLLAQADGRIDLFKTSDLAGAGGEGTGPGERFQTPRRRQPREYRPEGDSSPRFAYASPDGRWFAVLFHTRRLWVWDEKEQRDFSRQVAGQGNISAAVFTRDEKLAVADAYTRLSEYDLKTGQITRQFSPRLTTTEWIYWYPVKGLYTIFPKPGEMGEMNQYLVSGRQTQSINPQLDDLEIEQVKLNIWTPLWSNLAFVAVVLGLGCIYVSRKDY